MRIWGITDAGMARTQNQDCFLFGGDEAAQKAYCIVCDGMGGAAAGDIASKTALEVFASNILKDGQPDFTARDMERRVKQAAEEANAQVHALAESNSDYEGMGTTLVSMLVVGNQVVVGNVGDSRAYLIDDSGIRQITRDHSLVHEMVARGELSPYQAQRHPSRNVVTRVLGGGRTVECDTFSLTVKPGQYILLCSDGLTGEVSEPEVYYEVFFSEKPENACKTLVDIANLRGGHDNITIVLASF